MKKSLLTTGFLVLCLLLALPVRGAEEEEPQSVTKCLERVQQEVSQQQRLWRQVLIGNIDPFLAPEGTTLYDITRVPWIKTDTDRWVSARFSGQPRSDAEMFEQMEFPTMNEEVPGEKIMSGRLTEKGILASDAIPQIGEDYRTFGCRLEMVCKAISQSDDAESGEILTVKIPGCQPLNITAFDECNFANDEEAPIESTKALINALGDSVARTRCEPLIEDVATSEAEKLKFMVGYVAAVRTQLHFSGNLDLLLQEWKSDILGPLKKFVDLAHGFSNIPCLTTQCTND